MTELGRQLHRSERDTLSELILFDLNWQLPESLLQKADKMSMAASIELRTPILDREVASIAARVPSSLKLPPGGPGKLLLRHSLARKLDEPMRRPKKGFPMPLSEWFRGPLREQVEDTLFSSQSICLQELDAKLLRAAWNDFLGGAWDGALVLYSLWLYETWHHTLPR
jgi:asparagine synthase (glutamine-hydrolysing)